jgi:hypothetical protein
MKRLLFVFLGFMALSCLVLDRSYAQDVGAEIRESWGNATEALLQLEKELGVLSVVETKLSEQYSKLLEEIETLQAEFDQAKLAPESIAPLLQSCRMELQRLRWEEATEKVVQEELSKEDVTQLAPSADLKLKEIESQMKMLLLKREQAKANFDRVEALHKKGIVPSSELQEREAALQASEAELDSTQETLAMQKTIADAERKQPLTETTRRLAQLVSRRRILEEELTQLRDEHQRAAVMMRRQWQVSLREKRAELLQEQLVPIQTRKLQVQALIESYREELPKAEK